RAAQERHLGARQRRDVAAVDQNLALRRRVLAEDELEQRGLSGAARTGDEDHLAARDLAAQVVEADLPAGEALPDMKELNHRCGLSKLDRRRAIRRATPRRPRSEPREARGVGAGRLARWTAGRARRSAS